MYNKISPTKLNSMFIPLQKCEDVKLVIFNKGNHRWIRSVENNDVCWFEYWDGRPHYCKGSKEFKILEQEYQRLLREDKLKKILGK